MTDPFANHTPGLDSPTEQHYLIVASETPLDPRPRAIRCEAAGTITLVDKTNTALPYTMAVGEIMPMRAIKATVITSGGTFYAEV